MSAEQSKITGLAAALAETLGDAPEVAVVLGSGWKQQAAGLLSEPQAVACSDLPGWPTPRVAGHSGELILGTVAGRRALLCGGRIHSYEGYPAADLVRGVRALAEWGTSSLLLLNAAGSLREDLPPGSLVALRDHINFGIPSPLRADQTADGSVEFVDLVDLYEPAWREALRATCPDVEEGVYAGLPGPNYETPSEIAMLSRLGADLVGMSTIPEAIAARAVGLPVMAMSMATNLGAGLEGSRPSHGEVLDTAAEYGGRAAEVLAAAVAAAPQR
ncbi:MAG: purine-nucleoside phosphorylase [Planctomycetes bacterium]|nr:purine-nucleoside phosphorylase [Planctomycetota bacterium]